jgi:hypothetical protein
MEQLLVCFMLSTLLTDCCCCCYCCCCRTVLFMALCPYCRLCSEDAVIPS